MCSRNFRYGIRSCGDCFQLDKKANGSFQGTAQSDEDDMEDEYDAPSGDAPGDTINNGNDCFDETEISWLVLHI